METDLTVHLKDPPLFGAGDLIKASDAAQVSS